MENPTTATKPHIIFITIDQMRFPMHLPPDAPTPDLFVEKYMPNLFNNLWRDGVKFANHYTAASDCTAARATMYTGLYAYQTYSMLTLTSYWLHDRQLEIRQPQLDPDFPTIGRLIYEKAGYQDRPYFGKWHLSYDAHDLTQYGFNSFTPPEDYPGFQTQGYHNDGHIARNAGQWIYDHRNSVNPFFFSVNFINPHDKQWFWAGMNPTDFEAVYEHLIPEEPAQKYHYNVGPEGEIPSYGYPLDITNAIPNWQSQLALMEKPRTQRLIKEVFQYQMGGILEPDEEGYIPVTPPEGFYYKNTHLHEGKHKAIAPYPYWTTALNSYVQIMQLLDNDLGQFFNAIPDEVRQKSVFILTSDHGEYGSSHGLQGKGGTVYEEGIRVPLIVCDPSGRYTDSPALHRTQLTSSVDLLPMIVSLGYGGGGWMTGDYQQLYANRCDLLRICKQPNAPGRPYVLHSTDEFIPDAYNYLDAPLHVIGQIQLDAQGNKQKLGVYTRWATYSSTQSQATVLNNVETELEYYDHGAEPNEVNSTPNSADAREALNALFGVPGQAGRLQSELQAPLPGKILQEAQRRSYHHLQDYMQIVNDETANQNSDAKEESERRLARAWAL